MKQILFAAIAALTSHALFGQSEMKVLDKPAHGTRQFPDSIRVEFQDKNAFIVFQFKRPQGVATKMESAFGLLGSVLNTVDRSLSDFNVPRSVVVTVSPNGESKLAIQQITGETRIIANEKEITQLLPPGWDVTIRTADAQVYAYAQTYEQLKAVASFDLKNVIGLVRSTTEAASFARKRIIARIILNKDEIVFKDFSLQMPEDFLVGTVGAGVGVVGNKFYPDLSAVITIRRGDHFNFPLNKFSLLYNNMFFMEPGADGGYKVNSNSFLSLGWSIQADRSGQYIGLGAGYLIHRKGNYFKGNTAKFFVSKDFGHFNIAPEFYLTNDFNDFQMGIRLNYTF